MKETNVDEELILQIKNGSDTAVTELVLRYLPLIRHKAAGYSLPGMERDDLVQEGLLGLLKAISLYDGSRSSFATFASLCVSSSMATAAKSALSQKNLPLFNYVPLSDGELPASGDNPAEQLASREQVNELLHRISTSLSSFEQQVLRLYLTGHPYQAIADLLSTSPKAVDNALQRIRRKLRTA